MLVLFLKKIVKLLKEENPKKINWKISINRENHQFDKTVILTKSFAAKFSRIDMRFNKYWQNEEFKYFVEAKNLKSNDSGLKRRYIKTGIDNFLKGGKYFDCNGFLVGYILEGTIKKCIDGINNLLKKEKRENEIIKKISTFISIDSHFSFLKENEIYHLFPNYIN